MEFKVKTFIYFLVAPQLTIYLLWCFVDLSFITPLIDTFEDSESRFFYILFMLICIIFGLPHYLPNKEEKL